MNIDSCRTYGEVAREARRRLAAVYPPGEAAMMVRIIFEQLKGFSQVDMIVNDAKPCSAFISGEADKAVRRLLDGEPIQYIYGTARFCGLDIAVSRAVLIPRPETEELVDSIVSRYGSRRDLRVLDVGTGSGCIAVALARALPFAEVDAIDISADALAVARSNAKRLKVSVDFRIADALAMTAPPAPLYDIIVSNPPYIAESERAAMEPNVLLHEPHAALFVPDSDPLRFYRAISRYAVGALSPGGTLWFEINPLFAREVKALLRDDGFDDVVLCADAQKLTRFARATKPDWQ